MFLPQLSILVFLGLIQPILSQLDTDGSCSHHLVRQEWSTLTVHQKQEYINAVICTREIPGWTDAPGVQTRFDDFHATHINTAKEIHYVGHFLPWHRSFVSLYERVLRNECGYRGAIPYWDWSKDVQDGRSFRNSSVFDPINGFGGDGVPGTYRLPENWHDYDDSIYPSTFGGCIMDGPFASIPIHLGPGLLITTHCLVRKIDETSFAQFLSKGSVQKAMEQPTFELFRHTLEGGEKHAEHDSGHLIIGGDFGNLYSSPADPLFFLHHANLDRIWWTWQSMDLDTRLSDISGHVKNDNTSAIVELDYVLNYTTLHPGVPIRNVMDIRTYPLCYTYL